MALDSITRVFTGDFSEFAGDVSILMAVIVTLLASWYFSFNALARSTVRNRFRELIHGRRSDFEADYDPSADPQGDANQEASPPGESQDDGTSPADFRAAGDGWEGEEDIDYVVDEELLNQG